MRAFLRTTAAVCAILVAFGCSSFRSFQGEAKVHGGHDAAGGADQIYFQLRNVEGLGGPIAALVLPEDWPERSAVASDDGTLRLDPPIEPVWTFGDDVEPRARLRSLGPTSGNLEVVSDDAIPLRVDVVEDDWRPRRRSRTVSRRLGVGGSVYALVDTSDAQDEEQRVKRFVLHGARLAEDGDIEWVELCELELRDGRGSFARGADVVVRRSRAFEIVFVAAAATWPIWIWFVV